jgi:hypothetical protein
MFEDAVIVTGGLSSNGSVASECRRPAGLSVFPPRDFD